MNAAQPDEGLANYDKWQALRYDRPAYRGAEHPNPSTPALETHHPVTVLPWSAFS